MSKTSNHDLVLVGGNQAALSYDPAQDKTLVTCSMPEVDSTKDLFSRLSNEFEGCAIDGGQLSISGNHLHTVRRIIGEFTLPELGGRGVGTNPDHTIPTALPVGKQLPRHSHVRRLLEQRDRHKD